MKRKIDADSQGAENQREESRLEIDRHRMPRQQIDAYEQVERPPEEINDGGGRADIIFLKAPESEDEMRRFCGAMKKPCMANMVPGGKTPSALFAASHSRVSPCCNV